MRLTALLLAVLLSGGCAGSYRSTKPYVPCIQMDSVIITQEVNDGQHLYRVCDDHRGQSQSR
jgi:hypothetical protein